MQHIIDYAKSFLGVPYIWGGSSRLTGLDCSGLVQEILLGAGIDPPGDQSAQALYDHFEKNSTWNVTGAGSLVFYGKSVKQITHIAFMIDKYLVIEAGGGGSDCLTIEDAKKKNAVVRMRPYDQRSDKVAVLKPSYARIGII